MNDTIAMNDRAPSNDQLVVDVSQDWESASDFQQRFMHQTVRSAEGITYSARCRQLRAIGGDYYDFMPLAQNRLAFAIGDASGKSLPAALMIAHVQSSVRTAALFAGDRPKAVLAAVNHQLQSPSLADRFATLFYGVFEPATRLLRYASAGHHRPLLLRRDGSLAWLDPTGYPLGLFADSGYDESVIRMSPGDTLIAYTDGATEAVNLEGEEWAAEGLRKAARESKHLPVEQMVDALFDSLDHFTQGAQSDDVTIVALRAN
jgi:sigma-B regulation protein RsbU (phosphoserine phosphatase)